MAPQKKKKVKRQLSSRYKRRVRMLDKHKACTSPSTACLDEEPDEDGLTEDVEKEEFIQVLRSLLWDADESDNFIDDNESQGRQFGANYSPIGGGYAGNNRLAMQQQQNLLRWHGVLGRPMPQILKKQGLVGQAYRGFEDGCYKLACTLGINRLISQIGRMLG